MTQNAKQPSSTKMLAALQAAGIHPDKLSRRGDTYTARRGYFYGKPGALESFATRIAAAIPGARVVETTDEFRTWPKDSFYRVDFKIEPEASEAPTDPVEAAMFAERAEADQIAAARSTKGA